MKEEKWYYAVVHDTELNKDVLCMVKATSKYHALNIFYSSGHAEAKIATESDIDRIRCQDKEEYEKAIKKIYGED